MTAMKPQNFLCSPLINKTFCRSSQNNRNAYSSSTLRQKRETFASIASVYSTGCFKKSYTMVFQMLLFGECYENVYN
jgi:hypothetical protein